MSAVTDTFAGAEEVPPLEITETTIIANLHVWYSSCKTSVRTRLPPRDSIIQFIRDRLIRQKERAGSYSVLTG